MIWPGFKTAEQGLRDFFFIFGESEGCSPTTAFVIISIIIKGSLMGPTGPTTPTTPEASFGLPTAEAARANDGNTKAMELALAEAAQHAATAEVAGLQSNVAPAPGMGLATEAASAIGQGTVPTATPNALQAKAPETSTPAHTAFVAAPTSTPADVTRTALFTSTPETATTAPAPVTTVERDAIQAKGSDTQTLPPYDAPVARPDSTIPTAEAAQSPEGSPERDDFEDSLWKLLPETLGPKATDDDVKQAEIILQGIKAARGL